MVVTSRVIFRPERVEEDDWQIRAYCSGARIEYITGFLSRAEIDEWLSGEGRQNWLEEHGYE